MESSLSELSRMESVRDQHAQNFRNIFVFYLH